MADSEVVKKNENKETVQNLRMPRDRFLLNVPSKEEVIYSGLIMVPVIVVGFISGGLALYSLFSKNHNNSYDFWYRSIQYFSFYGLIMIISLSMILGGFWYINGKVKQRKEAIRVNAINPND